MSQKKAVLYPFSESSLALALWNAHLDMSYDISVLVAPAGLGLNGKDAGFADNRGDIGMVVSDDLDAALIDADALIVPFGDIKATLYKDIFEIMLKAAKDGKDIISCLHLGRKETKELTAICKANNRNFSSFFKDNFQVQLMPTIGLHKTELPVIFIGEIIGNTNELELALSLAEKFKYDGLRVTVVGASPNLNYLGYHSSDILVNLIQGLFSGGSACETIKLLNAYFYGLELKEQTDIFIVHVPGALIESLDFPNDCGVYAYILGHAIKPSCFIGGSYYAKYTRNNFEQLSRETKNRLDCELASIHISNKSIAYMASKQKRKLESVFHPHNEALKRVKEMTGEGVPVFNMHDAESFEQMYQNLQTIIWEE